MRTEEIATMALHKLMEIDKDSAQRFMVEEIDMSEKEFDSYGVRRRRKATDISWCLDEQDDPCLPKEVEIPYDIFDDDIADYLSDKYGYFVDDYDVEEEE